MVVQFSGIQPHPTPPVDDNDVSGYKSDLEYSLRLMLAS